MASKSSNTTLAMPYETPPTPQTAPRFVYKYLHIVYKCIHIFCPTRKSVLSPTFFIFLYFMSSLEKFKHDVA